MDEAESLIQQEADAKIEALDNPLQTQDLNNLPTPQSDEDKDLRNLQTSQSNENSSAGISYDSTAKSKQTRSSSNATISSQEFRQLSDKIRQTIAEGKVEELDI